MAEVLSPYACTVACYCCHSLSAIPPLHCKGVCLDIFYSQPSLRWMPPASLAVQASCQSAEDCAPSSPLRTARQRSLPNNNAAWCVIPSSGPAQWRWCLPFALRSYRTSGQLGQPAQQMWRFGIAWQETCSACRPAGLGLPPRRLRQQVHRRRAVLCDGQWSSRHWAWWTPLG